MYSLNKAKFGTVGLVVWGCGLALAQPPPQPTAVDRSKGVVIKLGATNQENGLYLRPAGSETKTRVANVGDRECRATDRANNQWWMEFKADDAFLMKDLPTGLSLEVEYFDAGQGPITLMYRARVRGVPVREHHLRIGQRVGTNTWKTLRVSLPDAYLPGWGPGWMLRLSGEAWPPNQWEDLYVGSVRLDRKGVWLTAVPDALAVNNPEPCQIRALITDEAGQPVKEVVTVKFETSAGQVTAEADTKEGVATATFAHPSTPSEVEMTAKCDVGEGKLKVPVVPGSGRVLLRKRVLGFEPGDAFDATKSVKEHCERLDLSVGEEGVYEGSGSARMDYAFAAGARGRAGVFVGKTIPGRPVRLRAQVYADRPACEVHFILKDSQGQETDRYGGTLWTQGWSLIPNTLDSPQVPWHPGAQKPLQYPLSVEHLVLVGTPWNGNRYKPAGTVYFDYLVAEFLAAESELKPIPLEVTAGQQGEKLMVVLKNVSNQPCTARSSYWLTNPDGVWIGPHPITKPLKLQPGEVVEFPQRFPEIPEDPQMMKPGEYAVEIAAVIVETGDLVEIQSKWRKQ